MAMIDIEYRFSDGPLDRQDLRNRTTKDMEFYIRGLVFEMQSADISVRFKTSVPAEGERNMVYINGRPVPEILEGLEIRMPEPDEGTCGCSSPKVINIGGPDLTWNTDYIEDIPDILMKNAISKVYADMDRNRIM